MPDVFLLIAQRSEHIPMWILRFYNIKFYFLFIIINALLTQCHSSSKDA